jgi:hypothetical protein
MIAIAKPGIFNDGLMIKGRPGYWCGSGATATLPCSFQNVFLPEISS